LKNSNDSNKTDNSQIVRFPLPWWEGIKREGELLTFYDAVRFGIWVIVIWDLPFDWAQGGELVEPFGI